MSGLRVLAVDDERPALEDLARLLRSLPDVESVEVAASGEEALAVLAREQLDGLFLDVRMPGLDGLELARVLRRFEHPPGIVFVSAYDDFAVEAFELRALDYLRKPVARRRLEEAVARVRGAAAGVAPAAPAGAGTASESDDLIAVDSPRGGTHLIPRPSVLVLQAHGDYVRVYADAGRFLLRATMAELEERWAPHGFVRVHRGFLVNLRRATEVRPRLNGTAVLLLDDGREVPIARRQIGDLRRRLAA